jgi:hypothetical protein
LIQVFYDSSLDFFYILCKNSDWYFILNYRRGKTMQFKRILGLALVLSLVFVLAACTGAAATPTTAPEATTAVDSGDTGDSGSADLPETASVSGMSGGTFTVNHPSGWTATPADGTGSIGFLGSDPTLIVSATYYDSTMGADAATVINNLVTGVTASGGTASDVNQFEINGRPAASVTVTVATIESTYVVATLENGYVYVSGSGVDTSVLEAIAASASFAS